MSQVLTVPTSFNDIGELSEGFLDRVEQDTLILYGPVPYEDGSDIDFVVLLADGTSALEGKGRVRAAIDGGAERVPETRYDVVVEALELEGRYEVIFERLVMARQAVSDRPPAEDDAPVTGDMEAAPSNDENEAEEAAAPEVEIAAEEVFSVPLDEVISVPPGAVEDVEVAEEDDDETEMEKYASSHEEQALEEAFQGEVDEDGEPLVAAEPNVGAPVPMPSMAAPPEAPPAPEGLNVVAPPEGLMRPSRAGADEDLIASYEEVGEEEDSGLFEYEEGLPIPSRPPLPDLDPARRVAAVEANDVEDVEDSEPPEANDDYEEIRLSELAESAEEG
ncbi:MAG: hypothetical protein O7F08_03770 [Deltaproteobacteria bacterium]|nr:hypothetical protein [Deltaproteobacteria bacterium]